MSLVSGSITTDTKVVLVNVVHFKSAWLAPFEKDLTEVGADFQTEAGGIVKVDMMSGEVDGVGYGEVAGAEVVSLPFEDPDYSMVIVKPKGRTARLQQVINRLAANPALGETIADPERLEKRKIQLKMPK